MNGAYKKYLVETFLSVSEQSERKIRARPLAGQGISPNVRVECSSSMRMSHPVGTKFVIQAKVTDREGGPPFLYTSFKWPYQVVTDEDAKEFIDKFWGGL